MAASVARKEDRAATALRPLCESSALLIDALPRFLLFKGAIICLFAFIFPAIAVARVHVNTAVQGSAYVEWGRTKVLASV